LRQLSQPFFHALWPNGVIILCPVEQGVRLQGH